MISARRVDEAAPRVEAADVAVAAGAQVARPTDGGGGGQRRRRRRRRQRRRQRLGTRHADAAEFADGRRFAAAAAVARRRRPATRRRVGRLRNDRCVPLVFSSFFVGLAFSFFSKLAPLRDSRLDQSAARTVGTRTNQLTANRRFGSSGRLALNLIFFVDDTNLVVVTEFFFPPKTR